ncbi:MAG: efflux RND transporter periplasmic adaptor subunit [Thermodesulfovibrionales bacterium]|nr:efflux RND transporter periplasmic adaptor subunit [Thermodesulfovibrionales bacterium]
MKKVLVLIIAIVLISAGFFAYKKFFSKPGIKILETAKVEKGSIRGVLVATGITKSQVGAVVKIGARTTGTIVKMNVKIGDRVRSGQLIALIDDREIQKTIEQHKAALSSAQHTLSQIELTYPERIREANANYEYARINYEREKELLKHEFTTKDTVDKAKSQFEASEANLKRLQDEYKTQIKIAKANVEDQTAQLRQQETRLTYTKIYAPIDGIVSDVTAQEGETIVAGLQVANLVTVLDPTRLEMWIYIDETDIGRVKLNHFVEYYVDTFPNKLFKGKIEKIYPQPVVKDNIVYYLAIVKVAGDDAVYLKPEMTAHVKIIFDEKTGILTAPNAAIKFEKGKQIAYKVIGRDIVQKTELKIGIRGEEKTEIVSGAKEGDELATKLILPVSAKEGQKEKENKK